MFVSRLATALAFMAQNVEIDRLIKLNDMSSYLYSCSTVNLQMDCWFGVSICIAARFLCNNF